VLTNAHCKNATCPPDKKRARLANGEGLYLETSPAGSKRWFAKIYRDGKETRLALLKNPMPFIKQANMTTGAQQVNNYAATPSTTGRQSGAENSQSEPNKLLEADHGQRLDIGAQAQAGRCHQALEAVGAVHRADNT
jgi:hypothetical protein